MNKQFLLTMMTTLLHSLLSFTFCWLFINTGSFWLCFYVIHSLLLSPFSQQCSKISWHCGAVQSHSRVQLFVTPWTAARQASVFLTISWSLSKFMSSALVMPSSHLILWCPFLLLPSIFPSITDFSNESTVHIKLPKY